jgi:pyruvate dehydrogenase E2 component (dihydrolipoamide acetyltransferase)
MATDIVMPNLGFDVQQARLIEWLKQPGDPIQKGEVIAVVESDKANVELESIAAGTVLELLVQPGGEVPVGSTIARVGQAQERSATPPPAPAQAPSAAPAQPTAVEISPVASKLAAEHGLDLSTVTGSGPRGRITREDVEAAVARQKAATPAAPPVGSGILALPKVRKAAREAGINLADVTATGPNGIITLADLQAYRQRQSAPTAEPATPAVAAPAPAPRSAPQPTPVEGAHAQPLSRIRQIIGRRMVESKREAPHFYVSGEFDLERAMARLKSLPEPRPGINDLIQFLTVQTLRRVPALNAIFQDDTIYQFDAVNLAVAVARDEGLVTPVLHGAERFSLTGLAQESRKLIERARANKLQSDDLQGGTFTISNLGVIRQVDQFVAILNPPQVAILAVGTVKQRPVVIDGGLHIRHTVHLTLSGDHRAVDGMHLGQFMAAFQIELDNFSQEK